MLAIFMILSIQYVQDVQKAAWAVLIRHLASVVKSDITIYLLQILAQNVLLLVVLVNQTQFAIHAILNFITIQRIRIVRDVQLLIALLVRMFQLA